MRDSVLYLYDRDGKKQLAMNDDDGSSPASRIVWTAAANGTYYVAVAGYGNCTGTYTLNVQTSNTAPVLAAIGDQTMSPTQKTLNLTLSATDADGDTLRWSAQAMTLRYQAAGADDRHEGRRKHGRQHADDQPGGGLYG